MSFASAFNDKPAGGLSAFDTTEAAPEYQPLPPGIYTARIVSGTISQTKKGDDSYKLTFEVSEGEQRGRRVARSYYFSPKAIGLSRRDLAAFGLTSLQSLLSPYPPVGKEIYVRLIVALKRNDDGSVFNDVKRIDIIRTEESPASKFLIDPDKSEGGTP